MSFFRIFWGWIGFLGMDWFRSGQVEQSFVYNLHTYVYNTIFCVEIQPESLLLSVA